MNSVPDFESLAFFGDSLTDAGGFFDLSGEVLAEPIPPESLGYAQVFSNGEVYSQIAPELLGIENVQNFALGGAAALGEFPLSSLINSALGGDLPSLLNSDADPETLALDLNLNAQINRFLATEETDTENTSASLFIGLGDFGRFVPTSPETAATEAATLASDIADATLDGASRLVEAGVDTIILNTLPGSSFFPLNSRQGPSDDTAVEAHNDLLRAGGAELAAGNADVIVVDFAAIAGEIAADPNAFGFLAPLPTTQFLGIGTNPTVTDTPDGPEISFPEDPTSLSNLDQQVFYDLAHPTTATHGIFGAFYSESVTSQVQILGSDNDVNQGSSIADDFILAGDGNDSISLSGQSEDVVLAGLGNDTVRGGLGDDIISLGSGNDSGFGNLGNDIIADGPGDDTADGGGGDDILIDGLGSDTSFGRTGDDIFVFSESSLIGGTDTEFQDMFDGGIGDDTLFLRLTDTTREMIAAADDMETALLEIGISTNSIEDIQFIDSSNDLVTTLETINPLISEADLFGLI